MVYRQNGKTYRNTEKLKGEKTGNFYRNTEKLKGEKTGNFYCSFGYICDV